VHLDGPAVLEALEQRHAPPEVKLGDNGGPCDLFRVASLKHLFQVNAVVEQRAREEPEGGGQQALGGDVEGELLVLEGCCLQEVAPFLQSLAKQLVVFNWITLHLAHLLKVP